MPATQRRTPETIIGLIADRKRKLDALMATGRQSDGAHLLPLEDAQQAGILRDELLALEDELTEWSESTGSLTARNVDGLPRRRPNPITGTATLRSGPPFEVWRDTEGNPVHALRPDQRWADLPAAQPPEDLEGDGPLSLGALVVAIATNDPRRAPREWKLAMGEGSNPAGGFLLPDPMVATVIDLARAQSAVVGSGAVTVEMTSETVRLARLASDPTFSVVGENTEIQESVLSFDGLSMTAHKIGTIITASRELLEDAPNVQSIIESVLGAAFAAELDRLALNGTGSAEPLGLLHHPAVAETDSVGAISWEAIAAELATIRALNYSPNAYILHPTIASDLDLLTTGDGETTPKGWLGPPPAIQGVARRTSTNCATANAFIGNFSQMAFGVRHGVRLEMSREAGNLFAKHQVGVKLVWRGSFAVLQGSAFRRLAGITT